MTRTFRCHAALAAIIATFAALATLYSFSTPLFETPDELDHYRFSRWVATNWTLPVLRLPPGKNVAAQEGGQAPLYYLLSAAATSWVGGREAPFVMPPNPHGGAGGPGEANKNIWLHDNVEQKFPLQGDYLAAHLVRIVSVLLGAATVLFAYLIARTLWPQRQDVAVLAAAIIAFNPQFIFISAAISNDVSAAFSAAVALWALVNLVVRTCSKTYLLATGCAIGIGLLSKVSFAPMFPLALAVGYVHWRRRRTPRLSTTFLCLTAPAVLIAGWWYARNVMLYLDPLATSISAVLAGGGDVQLTLDELISDADGLRKSLWAVFGAFNIIVHPALYSFYDALMIGSGLGLVVSGYQARRRLTCAAGPVLLATWVLVVLVALVRWRFQVLGFQGRLLFPALPALAVLMSFGLLSALSGKAARLMSSGIAGALLIPAVAVPFVYLFPAYSPPAPVPTNEVANISHPVSVTFAEELELLGFAIETEAVEPGSRLPIRMYWRALKPISQDYSLFIHLLTPDGRNLGQVDTYPASTMFPTSRWPTDNTYAGNYYLTTQVTAQNVSYVQMVAGIYQVKSGQRATVRDASGRTLGDVVSLVKLPYRQLKSNSPRGTSTLSVFADAIALADFSIEASTIARGGTLRGEVHWRALRQMSIAYTTFFHVVKDGKLVAQHDGQPLEGRYSTDHWSVGEMVRDTFEIQIPATTPAGEYQLMVGLYDPATTTRLTTGRETYFIADIVRVSE